MAATLRSQLRHVGIRLSALLRRQITAVAPGAAQKQQAAPAPTRRVEQVRPLPPSQPSATTAADGSALERRLARQLREIETAFQFSQELAAHQEIGQLLHSAAARACTLAAGHAAAVCLLDAEGTSLQLAAASGQGVPAAHLRQSTDSGLAGQVIGQGKTVISDTTCSHCGFLRLQGPGQCVATPLRAGDQILGALCVVRAVDLHFEPRESQTLALLANSSACGVSNARLVAERRRQAEEAAAHAERERLAAELHDHLAQTLSYVNLATDRMQTLLATGQQQQALQELARIKSASTNAYGQVRAALTGLQTAVADEGELVSQIEACLAEFRQQSGLAAELQVDPGRPWQLPRLARHQALHIVREALTNVRRHAQARRVTVQIEEVDESVQLRVCDDGQGFDSTVPPDAGHLGLTIMRARAERSGGRLQVNSARGAGTCVQLTYPLPGGDSP